MTRDLYERYGRQIYAYCLHQLGSREEAEDATQTTFMNAFRGLQRGIVPELESAWLYKIASNVVLTRRRSSYRRRRVETPGDLDALQDLLPSPQRDVDELVRLDDALRGLPEQQRRALLLREWQGLSYREIAEELELSQSAVETLLFRARRSLAAALTEPERPRRKALARLRSGLDLGSVLAAAKALLSGGAAVKVAVTAAAVATTAVGAGTEMARHHLKPEPKAPKVAAAAAATTTAAPDVPHAHAPAPTSAPPARHVAAARKPAAHRSTARRAEVHVAATPVVATPPVEPTAPSAPPVVVAQEPVPPSPTTTDAPTPVVPAAPTPTPQAAPVAASTTTTPAAPTQTAPVDHARRSEAAVKEVVDAVVAKLRDARQDAPAPVVAAPPTAPSPSTTTPAPVEVSPASNGHDDDRAHLRLGLLHR
jgi:RNA polymerase sigma factor (sigma-70 family)